MARPPRGARRSPRPIRYPHRLRRHPVLAVTLLALLVLGVLARRVGWPGTSDDVSRYDNQVFTVVRVVDGDTLDLNIPDGRYPTTRVRLWGVDTPEVEGSPVGAMYFGREASTFTRRMVLNRTVRVVLAPARTRDKYERLLAYVHLEPDGPCLNEQLLETGHAYADPRFDHPFKRDYLALEERARRADRGLWPGVTFEQFPAWRQRMGTRDRSTP